MPYYVHSNQGKPNDQDHDQTRSKATLSLRILRGRSQRQTRNALCLGIVHRYVVPRWLHHDEAI